jgi:hypothetical protein
MFKLQHGPYECLLNTVEACAIHAWPKLVRLLDFFKSDLIWFRISFMW